MTITTALKVLKVNNFKDLNDIEYQYTKELKKAENAYQNSFNDVIKKEYASRIEELNTAFEFIKSNKHELNSKPGIELPSMELPSIEVNPKQKKLILIIGSVVIIIGLFLGVRAYVAGNYFDEGITLFRSMDYEGALPLFKKADAFGSLRGKYYYGKTLHFLFPHQRRFGFQTMKTAVEKGLELDSIEQGEYNLLKTKSENYNKL